jgi:hypothetical protein
MLSRTLAKVLLATTLGVAVIGFTTASTANDVPPMRGAAPPPPSHVNAVSATLAVNPLAAHVYHQMNFWVSDAVLVDLRPNPGHMSMGMRASSKVYIVANANGVDGVNALLPGNYHLTVNAHEANDVAQSGLTISSADSANHPIAALATCNIKGNGPQTCSANLKAGADGMIRVELSATGYCLIDSITLTYR